MRTPSLMKTLQLVPEESFWESERALLTAFRQSQELQAELVNADGDVLELGKRVRGLEAELKWYREARQRSPPSLSTEKHGTAQAPIVIVAVPPPTTVRVLSYAA